MHRYRQNQDAVLQGLRVWVLGGAMQAHLVLPLASCPCLRPSTHMLCAPSPQSTLGPTSPGVELVLLCVNYPPDLFMSHVAECSLRVCAADHMCVLPTAVALQKLFWFPNMLGVVDTAGVIAVRQ
jgi:hypothetical protein